MLYMDSVNPRLKAIIEEHLGDDIGEVTLDSNIEADLGASSLDRLELLLAVENAETGFNLEIPDEEADKILTVGHIQDFLVKAGKL